MIKKYNQFINENKFTETTGKLFIEPGDETNTEWKLIIDVSSIWQNFVSNKISLVDFNNQYAAQLLNQHEIVIQTVGESCWQDLEQNINELKQCVDANQSEIVYDNIYNLCDQYEILIDAGKQNNEMNNEISTNV